MIGIRLNAAAIAAGHVPAPEPPQDVFDLFTDSRLREFRISRRDLIKAAGVAATVASGALGSRTLEPLLPAATGRSARVAWVRAGAMRTILDPHRFAGAATLTVSENGTWLAAISGARYPGLPLSAELSIEVIGTGALARARLRHALGGFAAEVGVSEWLAGETCARAPVLLEPVSMELGDGLVLRIAGRGVVSLDANWSLSIEWPGIARLVGDGVDLSADRVTLALPGAAVATTFSRRYARRTLITLEGVHANRLPVPEVEAPEGRLDLTGCSGPSIAIECAESRAGAIHRALLARFGGRAQFVLGDRVASSDVALPLTDVRYARLLDGSRAFHIAATFAPERRWVVQRGRALLVGGAPWAPPFEASGSRGRVTVSARPALFAVSVPFEGGIASPIEIDPAARQVANLGGRARATRATGSDQPASSSESGLAIDSIISSDRAILLAAQVKVVRPDDMLVVEFELYNMQLDTSVSPARFVRIRQDTPCRFAVRFPPQHVLEQALLDPSQLSQLTPPLKAYLADPSCLAFEVSESRASAGIVFSIEDLLDWSGLTQRVVPAARRDPSVPTDITQEMRAPAPGGIVSMIPPETAIELPWGLVLSPSDTEFCWWSHRTAPFTQGGRTELWHTRLRRTMWIWDGSIGATASQPRALSSAAEGTSTGGASGFRPVNLTPVVRAVWARRYQDHLDAAPLEAPMPLAGMFRNSMSQAAEITGFQNRWNIVDLSARFRGGPIRVRNLMLTSLGGWLDVSGTWDVKQLKYEHGFPIPGSLVAWEHRATMGRDQYVKTVQLGNLFPFGQEAVEVTITERRVDAATGCAFLGQKTFIVVVEPVKTYSQENDIHKRRFPFSRVEILTRRTPELKPNAEVVPGLSDTSNARIVRTQAPDVRFLWQIRATDWDGVVHRFEMPLIWVKESTALKGTSTPSPAPSFTLEKCAAAMRTMTASMKGQRVAFAKPYGSGDSARVMPTNWMTFDAVVIEPTALGAIRYHPIMHQANVVLDAVSELTGQNAGVTIRIADIYRDNGYDGPNAAGKVIAALTGGPTTVPFPPQLSGGVATPIPRITGISASKGVFGGDEAQFGGGKFDPAQILDGLNAELFGGITLLDIIKVVAGGFGLDKMPVFEKVLDTVTTKTLTLRYSWQMPIGKKHLIFIPSTGCTLTLMIEVRKGLEAGAGAPSYEVFGSIGPFQLHLVPPAFDALRLHFGLFTFRSVNGATPTVSPDLEDVEFGADLKYLAKLAQYLGALGAASSSALATRDARAAATVEAGPLKIDVSASGIKASLTIAIPDLAIGAFSLKNMSFSAALTIPFTGDVVTLDFGFCSREAPFELMVMGFGGGGYVLMTFDVAGMRALEISFEFGAGTSFGIGKLASGSVELKGGLSVRYERREDGECLDFLVFIRIHGKLDILGLISVTLTFYLELRYQTFPKPALPGETGDKLTGTATLTIEIEIVFFTIPVKLTVTKTLAGEDPRFGDLMPTQADWDAYCEAFAPAELGA